MFELKEGYVCLVVLDEIYIYDIVNNKKYIINIEKFKNNRKLLHAILLEMEIIND